MTSLAYLFFSQLDRTISCTNPGIHKKNLKQFLWNRQTCPIESCKIVKLKSATFYNVKFKQKTQRHKKQKLEWNMHIYEYTQHTASVNVSGYIFYKLSIQFCFSFNSCMFSCFVKNGFAYFVVWFLCFHLFFLLDLFQFDWGKFV